jgi:hypothetical protein
MQTLLRYLPTAPEPWFVHLHLLDTHCCFYHPDALLFSGGSNPNMDARDSEIRETDANVQRLFQMLAASGRLERTIVVISSDHTSGWMTTGRVPLIIRFPAARQRGVVTANVQAADVAPTMLDYLGVKIPSWMDGVSLLDSKAREGRHIFAVSDITEREGDLRNRNLLDPGPPNYGTAAVSMIAGSRWFELSLLDGTLKSGAVEEHTRPQPSVPQDEARRLIEEQIRRAGFRVELEPTR